MVLMFCLFVVGCELSPEEKRGIIGSIEGFIGGVAVDEPRAALVGRDVLAAGGSAADAAVAIYFTLAVTMPSHASLGSGGVCLVHDQKTGDVQLLDFLARTPMVISPNASRPSAIPGSPRGMFALHARYGVLPWQKLVIPAANLARFGTQISRALASDFAAAREVLKIDPEITSIFTSSKTGELAGEGEFLKQIDLSIILSRMGTDGPGDFYTGYGAKQFVDAVVKAGGSLRSDDLRTYQPVWKKPIIVPFGNKAVYFSSPAASAGGVAASMWQMLTANNLYRKSNEVEKGHLLSETAMRAYADRTRWMLDTGDSRWSVTQIANSSRLESDMLSYTNNRHTRAIELKQRPILRPENPAATGFIAVDRTGGAVACGISMNNLFGTGRIAPSTGILTATIQNEEGAGSISLGPMMVTNPHTKNLFWIGVASGGVAAATALINVASRSIIDEEPLEKANAAKRYHHGGEPDITYYETGASKQIINVLAGFGHQLAGAPAIARVNAMSCFGGLPIKPQTCEISTDPRGFGLAFLSGK